ncbi:helix-turn-helix domain-containing protein [Virgibacillus sp. NKC19-3]|uniref:helix-turn-helix domain-containing protein n=1 Tax=Virgibacillus saliphilus TaxID=2831674 RepID=UPI001C9AB325|nr:helix-turn-helix domain-containing protein [Virgibacillus sp. NKC19-3]MBY7143467.1 helix-turn-helix domain-containing protein [Virgibacillus sp. NKC19-3]
MLFEGIILLCFLRMNAERTEMAIYHLLRAKKSIQTVQDAHLYNLEQFYGVYHHLNQVQFEYKLHELVRSGLLQESSSQKSETIYMPTKTGVEWINKHRKNLPFDYYNGLKFHDSANVFLERLTLLIQTLTNSKMNYFSFIPVIDKLPIENWVRSFYKKMKPHETKLLPAIHDELSNLLHYFSDHEAGMFVDRLTGFKNYGMSVNQLADKYEMTPDDVILWSTAIKHRMLNLVEKEQAHYPFLCMLTNDLLQQTSMTASARTTYELLQKKYSIDNISKIRQLKPNTIYDHIVEIALYRTDFPINDYVNEESQQDIINVFNNIKSTKLKNIKQQLNTDISYFQIRLVLARTKDLLK